MPCRRAADARRTPMAPLTMVDVPRDEGSRRGERAPMRRAFTSRAILDVAVTDGGLVTGYSERQHLSLAQHYLAQLPQGLGAPNVVHRVPQNIRGFDTLGEAAVLFMVAASVGIFCSAGGRTRSPPDADSERRASSEAGRGTAPRSSCRHPPVRRLCDHERRPPAGGGIQGRRGRRAGRRLADARLSDSQLDHGISQRDGVLAGS